MLRTFLLSLCVLGTSLFGADKLNIVVIPKGTTHPFWKSVEAGARKAAKEEDVELTFRGPLREDDRAQQIALVQQFVSSKVSGIVLAPLDASALTGAVKNATAKNIPVVIMDSALKADVGKDFVSFVATDNYRGGQLGGQDLGKRLNGKGKVVLLRYAEGSASTQERESGFLDAMKAFPDIELTVTNRYGGATISTAQDAAMNLIDRIRDADGIFCPNQSTTTGMLLALRQNGLAGKKQFVGFDASDVILAAIKKGDIQSVVAQNPMKMGYTSVKTVVASIRQQPLEQRVDTGCDVVNKENLDTPAIKDLLGGL